MDPLDPQFDDPALKAALRRNLRNESAPPSLRSRVVSALNQHERFAYQTRFRIYSLATAAVLLIAVGIAYMIFFRSNDRPIPQFLASAMVSVNEQYAAHTLTPDITDPDLRAIREKLRAQVGHPVLVAMLGDGWKFEGADVCKVSSIPAAHLLFTRGNESISIFSISALAFYDSDVPDGTGYAQMQNGEPISGFLYGGAVHCLVAHTASGKLSLSELTRLREQLRPAIRLQAELSDIPDNCHPDTARS
jgi:hypothetical protein